MDKQIEYETLREEILCATQVVKNYRSLLYTIVVAMLAYAFEKNESVLFLVPFIAIIPIYLLAMHQIDSTLRIGAYIYVFLEPGTECKWETRLHKYDQLHKNQYSTKKSSIDAYWCVSFSCLLLSIIKLDFTNMNIMFYVTIIGQIMATVICIYLFIKKRSDYAETKQKYINEWLEMKKEEQNTDKI